MYLVCFCTQELQKNSKWGVNMKSLELHNGFIEMSNKELLETEGGGWPVVVGIVVVALIIASTTKGCADADKEDK